MRYEITNVKHPFAGFFDLEREFNSTWRNLAARATEQSNWAPAVDVREREEHWLLSIDVPGVAREDIKVDVLENQLVVTGERHDVKEDKSYSERRYGRFERRFTLPEGVEIANIEASYAHGVLNLVVPKVQPQKPTSIAIDVKEGSGSLFQKLVSFGKKEEKENIN